MIVITGPIASGKSSVAVALATALNDDGVTAEVIDLDLVHDRFASAGATSDGSVWQLARRDAAAIANRLGRDGVAVVIAEGSFNAEADRAALTSELDSVPPAVFVTLTVSFAEALRRAQGDPTRGRSRDPGFLGPYFAGWSRRLADIPATDLVIDTERSTIAEAATTILRAFRQAEPGAG